MKVIKLIILLTVIGLSSCLDCFVTKDLINESIIIKCDDIITFYNTKTGRLDTLYIKSKEQL